MTSPISPTDLDAALTRLQALPYQVTVTTGGDVLNLSVIIAGLVAERDELRKAMVKAVSPLEAMTISGAVKLHHAKLQVAVREGIEAVRNALPAG